MTKYSLLDGDVPLPRIEDRSAVELGYRRLREETDAAQHPDALPRIHAFAREPRGRALVEGVFAHSPYLTGLILRDPSFFADLIEAGADATIARVFDALPPAAPMPENAAELMRALRIARARTALVAALADIAGTWPLARVTATLADIAEKTTDAAVRFWLAERAAAGHLVLADADDPARGSGFVVLGMGKLGARELNYSSDVDLIVLFEPDAIDYRGLASVHDLAIDITKRLVRTLQERTADGYVFRTDLRLRPDAGATPIAISMAAAEHYYESVGQNWERAAFIKARPIAGDIAAGATFLKRIGPFVWRKHLDFAAIADIHSIKRQIHAHHGHADVSIAGHNIKLGRGGIREIEFFVQTQQLIAGGRDPRLRTRDTVSGLNALAAARRIDRTVCAELCAAYAFLRRVEHRLQMVNDEQTHSLPKEPAELARIAAFLGYADMAAFAAALEGTFATVVGHYGRLFEHAPPLGSETGSLVFTGTGDDPDTIATLVKLGFRQPAMVAERIRSWHHGRFHATRTVRARELLTALMPRLLEALAATADPDAALARFDEFLSKLPAGVQLFSLFYENPHLLTLVAEIMGTAPRLADELARTASLLDVVLSAGFFEALPAKAELRHDLGAILAQARDFEDVLDFCRRFANERQFQVGVQMLRRTVAPSVAAGSLSDLADVLVTALVDAVGAQIAARHGRVPGGAFAVIGYGKLGSRELTPASDLDLVFVYDAPEAVTASDGTQPLAVSQYYGRLSQRLITAITTLTAAGRLYTVDVRLRPAGAKGAIASEAGAFQRYLTSEAWTWEHMALSRARVVAAPPPFTAKLAAVIAGVLAQKRDVSKLRNEVHSMRERIAREHRGDGLWDIKYGPGGLVDAEFLCQYLLLAHAADHPAVVGGSTAAIYEKLGSAGLLPVDEAAALADATRLLYDVQAILRLTTGGPFDQASALDGLKRALATGVGLPDIDTLAAKLTATRERVEAAYLARLGAV